MPAPKTIAGPGSHGGGRRPGITRRRLMLGSSQVALLTVMLAGCGNGEVEPEPFSDGTFFDDGTGWVA